MSLGFLSLVVTVYSFLITVSIIGSVTKYVQYKSRNIFRVFANDIGVWDNCGGVIILDIVLAGI